jgi:hypothetical protein
VNIQVIHSPLRTTFSSLRKNADKLIKRDPVRAIVELVTNSDDSYRGMEKGKSSISGKIIIEVIRSRPHSVIEILDEAEGMDASTMHRVVQLVGREEGEELSTGKRGFFREGLKFAMIGMGYGFVHSIKDERLYRCSIDNKGFYHYEAQDEKPATPIFREQYVQGVKNNGTLVKLILSRDDVSLPSFDKLVELLSSFFSLRDLLSNQTRKVYLIECDRNRREKTKVKLEYSHPKGERLLNTELSIQGYPEAKIHLEVFKTSDPLRTKWDVGSNDYRENGLIVRSGGAIHDITLFRFDNEDYKDITAHLFGFLTCDYIKKLMEEGDDQIVNGSRDGINIYHPFIKEVRMVVEAELKKIIDEERKIKEREISHLESTKIKKLIRKNLSLLNSIAKKELSDLGAGPTGERQVESVPIPPDGFNFFPELDYLVIGKKYGVKLIGDLSAIPVGSLVTLEMDNSISNDVDIEYSPKKFVVQDTDVNEGVWIRKISLEGKKIDAQRTLTAQFRDRTAEAVFVVVKGGRKGGKRGSSGLIKDIKFDPEGDPQQRFRFMDGVIKIHTRAPSISRYYGLKGEGQEKLHSRILMAELIIEAIVGYIARQKALAGRLVILDIGNPQEAIERERNKLQYQYAHLIHKGFVQEKEI